MIPGPKTSIFSCERSRKGKERGMDRSDGLVHGHKSLVWTGTHDGI